MVEQIFGNDGFSDARLPRDQDRAAAVPDSIDDFLDFVQEVGGSDERRTGRKLVFETA